jgi:hypothetical protein
MIYLSQKNYTTNPQAEILIFNKIKTRYIEKIIFPNNISLDKLKEESVNGDFKNRMFVDSSYFSYRTDYKFWQKDSQ